MRGGKRAVREGERRPLPLGTQLTWSFALLFIVLLVLGNMLIYQVLMGYSTEQTSRYTRATVAQAQTHMDESLRRMLQFAQVVQKQDSIMQFLSSFPENRFVYAIRRDMYTFFNNVDLLPAEVVGIYIVREGKPVYQFVRVGSYYDGFMALMAQGGPSSPQGASSLHVMGPIRTDGLSGTYTSMFSVSDLYDLGQLKKIGQLIVQLRYDSVFAPLAQAELGEGGQIQLADAQGTVLYATEPSRVGTRIEADGAGFAPGEEWREEDGNLLLAMRASAVLGWQLYASVPMSTVMRSAQAVQYITLVITAVGVLAILLLVPLMSRRFTRPLGALSARLERMEPRGVNAPPTRASFYELQVMGDAYEDMLLRLDGMMEAVVEARMRQKDAELKALQAQVKPHFLYNTLDVLHWRALINQQDELASLIRSLGQMMRYNITDGDRLVTVREEVRHLEHYLALQKARYGDELNYSLEMAPEAQALYLTKFLLQPLVENAVVHGLHGRRDGRVLLRAAVEEGCLRVEVQDNGRGFDAELLDRIARDSVSALKSAGIGLSNVSERIRLRYESPYGLAITSGAEGTCVRLTLPVLETADDTPYMAAAAR